MKNWKMMAFMLLALFGPCASNIMAQEKSAFSSATIDLGVVVTDIEKAAKFYTEAIGFKELKGFDVPADFAGEAGLTAKKIPEHSCIRSWRGSRRYQA